MRDITNESFLSFVDQHASILWDTVLEEFVYVETIEGGRVWRWLEVSDPDKPDERALNLVETNEKYRIS